MKISQFRPRMDEYANALAEAFSESLATELDFPVADRLFPADGFIPFVDQAMSADLFLFLNEESLHRICEYVAPQFAERLENESAFAYCSDIAEFVRDYADDPTASLQGAALALDNSVGKIWENGEAESGQAVRKSLYQLANGIWDNMAEDMREQFEEWRLERMDETEVIRLRLGCTVAESEKEPFCAFLSLNFDAPYFRSNGEIAINAKPNRELDVCLSETLGQIPGDEEQFRTTIDKVVRTAFPNLGLDDLLYENRSLAPGA